MVCSLLHGTVNSTRAMKGTSKVYSPTSLDQVETFGFRGEGTDSVP